ncbi:MAG: hypothetical protein WCC38_11840 [Pseudonocardiaceae bacterium]
MQYAAGLVAFTAGIRRYARDHAPAMVDLVRAGTWRKPAGFRVWAFGSRGNQ